MYCLSNKSEHESDSDSEPQLIQSTTEALKWTRQLRFYFANKCPTALVHQEQAEEEFERQVLKTKKCGKQLTLDDCFIKI